jgi:hypothetical protein
MSDPTPAPAPTSQGPTSAPAPTVRDHDHWTSGDFAIISSDNVRHRVDERYLRAAR